MAGTVRIVKEEASLEGQKKSDLHLGKQTSSVDKLLLEVRRECLFLTPAIFLAASFLYQIAVVPERFVVHR